MLFLPVLLAFAVHAQAQAFGIVQIPGTDASSSSGPVIPFIFSTPSSGTHLIALPALTTLDDSSSSVMTVIKREVYTTFVTSYTNEDKDKPAPADRSITRHSATSLSLPTTVDYSSLFSHISAIESSFSDRDRGTTPAEYFPLPTMPAPEPDRTKNPGGFWKGYHSAETASPTSAALGASRGWSMETLR